MNFVEEIDMKKIDLGNISIGSGDIENSCTSPIVTPPESCGCDQNNNGCHCGCEDSYGGIDIGDGNGSENGGCG